MHYERVSSSSEGWRRPKICTASQLLDTKVLQSISQALEQAPKVPWVLDVHSHCQKLEDFVQHTVRDLMVEQDIPRKSHVSQDSLALTRVKSSWLREMQKANRQVLWWMRWLAFRLWVHAVAAVHIEDATKVAVPATALRAGAAYDDGGRTAKVYGGYENIDAVAGHAMAHIKWFRCTRVVAEWQRAQHHILLKRRLRKDRLDYINDVVEKTQKAIDGGDTREAFAKLRLLRKRPPRQLPMLKDKGGDMATSTGQVQEIFRQHFGEQHHSQHTSVEEYVTAVRENDCKQVGQLNVDILQHLPRSVRWRCSCIPPSEEKHQVRTASLQTF